MSHARRHYCPNNGTTAYHKTELYFCPPGLFCPAEMDHPPDAEYHQCPIGHYCPRATPAPVPCPLGTYNPVEGKASVVECQVCAPICEMGVSLPEARIACAFG